MDNTLGYSEMLAALRMKRERIEEAILVMERLARDEAGQESKVPAWVKATASDKQAAGRASSPKKRTISAAGRKRIAEAVRKRWAAKRAAEAGAAKTAGTGTRKKATKKRAG